MGTPTRQTGDIRQIYMGAKKSVLEIGKAAALGEAYVPVSIGGAGRRASGRGV
jgi:hypothetical protein